MGLIKNGIFNIGLLLRLNGMIHVKQCARKGYLHGIYLFVCLLKRRSESLFKFDS